jgi:Ni/Fe-hydrogenase b-type cytochrome subunit
MSKGITSASQRDLRYLRVSNFIVAANQRVRAVYEHPTVVRVTHWVAAISIVVLSMTGLQIFFAFPSFGPKIPQHNLFIPPTGIRLGGWLGGALRWHFTFMWFFMGSGVLYLLYEILSGHYRTVLFRPRDIRGVWPMARHYFFFGKKPEEFEPYNPLQKLAYTTALFFGALSMLTGLVLYKPIQFKYVAFLLGGFHFTRILHFAAMCGLWAFLPGHLLMVVIHGWDNFASMLFGWKKAPAYIHEQDIATNRNQ